MSHRYADAQVSSVALFDLYNATSQCWVLGRLNIAMKPIAHQYCEGLLKSTLHREFKVREAGCLKYMGVYHTVTKLATVGNAAYQAPLVIKLLRHNIVRWVALNRVA